MGLKKEDIIGALNIQAKELQYGIDKHCALVVSILDEQMDERNLQHLSELCPNRSREMMLENAIKGAIDVLEESRKAFKSKRLEVLRKKLTCVLIDAD